MTWPMTLQVGLIVLALAAALSILIGSLRAGISPMPSSRKAHQAVLSMLNVPEQEKGFHNGCGRTLIDCGSGWGHLAFRLARRYPDAQVVGYELSLIPYLVSRLLARFFLLNNLTIFRKNFMHCDLPVPLHQADTLFTYLYPEGMAKLSASFDKRPERRPQELISICFALPGFEAKERKILADLYQTQIYRYVLSTP